MIEKVNCNTPSFGARIIQTPYFKEGLHSATKFRDDNISLESKVNFLNAVKLIESDDSISEFRIEGIGSLKDDGKARKCRFVIDGKATNIDSSMFWCILDGPNCIEAVTRFAQERYGNVYADNLTKNASVVAKDIDKQRGAIHRFINNDLERRFNISSYQLIDDHRKVFNELPNEGLKYIDMYY